jgi:hypothetical protein
MKQALESEAALVLASIEEITGAPAGKAPHAAAGKNA